MMLLQTASRSDDPIRQLKHDLVLGLHILDLEGQGCDIAGHVTSRLPQAETFWTNRFRLGFDEAAIEELHKVDMDLNVVVGDGKVSPALDLHSAIYKKHNNVNAIVHTHPLNAVALSTISHNLENVDQQAAPFFKAIGLFDEYHGIFGNGKGGVEEIATELSNKRALILRNHGIVVVGKDVREAVVGAILLEKAAAIQLRAMSAGNINTLPDEAAAEASASLSKPELFDWRFDYFARRAIRQRKTILKALNF